MNEQIQFTLNIDGVDKTINTVGDLKQNLDQLKKSLETTSDKGAFQNIQKEIKKGEEQLTSFNKTTKGGKEAFMEAAKGVKIFGTGFDDVSKLFLANPIGLAITAITVAVGVLVDIFKTFAPVMDFISDKMAYFGSILNGVKNMIASFVTGSEQMTGSLLENAKAAERSSQMMRDYEDSISAVNLANKQYDAQIEILLKQAKNKNLTLDESNKILQKALQLQLQQIKMNEENAKLETSMLIEKAKSYGVTYKQILEIQKGASVASLNLTNMEAEDALVALQNNYSKRIELQGSYEAQKEKIQNLVDANEIKREEEQDKNQAKREADRKKKLDDEKAKADKEFEEKKKKNAFQVKYEDSLMDKKIKEEEERKKAMEDLDARALASFGDEEEADNKLTDSQLKNIEKLKKEDIQAQKDKKEAAEAGAESIADISSGLAQLMGDNAEAQKAAALVEVLANQGVAISNAAAVAFAPSPDNLVTGGLSGLAKMGTFVAAIIGTIGSVLPLVMENGGMVKFASGGFVNGPSHAQGGVKFAIGGNVAELEGGEGVINKRSMSIPAIRNMASALNVAGGGVDFSIPMMKPKQDSVVQNDQQPIKVYVSEADITRVQNKVKAIEQRSILR